MGSSWILVLAVSVTILYNNNIMVVYELESCYTITKIISSVTQAFFNNYYDDMICIICPVSRTCCRKCLSKNHLCFPTAQKISPEGKPKVQLQIVLHDISSYTFHFCNPEGRDKQVAERNQVKVSFYGYYFCMNSLDHTDKMWENSILGNITATRTAT